MKKRTVVRFRRGMKWTFRMAGRMLLLCLGSISFAIAINVFYKPGAMLSGGVAGASLLVFRLTGFPMGVCVILLNIPIFLLGFRDMGKSFAFLSGLGVILFSLFVDLVRIGPVTGDPMLAAVFGGVLAGLGTSLALRTGGSLGGFDILGVVINRRFGTGVGEALMVMNGLLVVAAGFSATPEAAMYTLVAIFSAGKTVEVLQTPRPRKAFLIMTRTPGPVRARIVREMNRGVTQWEAEGVRFGKGMYALLCVVTRMEIRELSQIVREEDPWAFTIVLEASDVLGRFRRQTAYDQLKRMHGRHHLAGPEDPPGGGDASGE